MISATDVPACPACGSREVHPVQKMSRRLPTEELLGEDPPLEMFYACRGCGRDQTDAWQEVQPKPKMKPLTPGAAAAHFDRVNAPDKETIREAAMRLGVGATIKVET